MAQKKLKTQTARETEFRRRESRTRSAFGGVCPREMMTAPYRKKDFTSER